ncbi:hypothetical protein AZE42_13962 [Rhizopogon vesiculosus]|uniref:Uncharacterized protein n=1 Tax=Rhizopogon vesiculosus TaxID=180088 RepID=A0A1J8Q3Z2_9AGAM|nr:hypothetical protein AZE42_13962 [Rhizopogon vesiculosus]
MKAISRIW